jgi:Stress responsive A/B Barrel Domain
VFRHVVLFRFTPESTPDQQEAMLESLRGLPAEIPEIKGYQAGSDQGLVEGNWHAGLVADFDDQDGWRTYSTDPVHLQIIADQVRPILAERAAFQYVF